MKSDHTIVSMYTLPIPTLQYEPDLSTPWKGVYIAHGVPENPYQWHSKRKSRAISGSTSVLPVQDEYARPKRTKFGAKRRAEVADIRHKGACLRCRLDKTTCSSSWPCESCHRSQISGCARVSKRQWMHCIPFSFKEVDIYANCESNRLSSY